MEQQLAWLVGRGGGGGGSETGAFCACENTGNVELPLPEAASCRDAEADVGRCAHFLWRSVLNTDTNRNKATESVSLSAVFFVCLFSLVSDMRYVFVLEEANAGDKGK